MKNIAVGRKILLCFSAVILMIAIILVLTLVTSTQRNADLQRVDAISSMQREANQLLENFLLARVEIRALFSTIYAEEEYNQAVIYLAASEANLDRMRNISTQLDGHMSEELGRLENLFIAVHNGIDAVATNDQRAVGLVNLMMDNGTIMSGKSSDMFEYVINATKQMVAVDDPQALSRFDVAVTPAKELNDTVEAARLLSRNLTLQQDLAVIPEIDATIEKLNSQGAALKNTLSTTAAQQAVDEVLIAAEQFHQAIKESETTLLLSEDAIGTARLAFTDLNNLVNQTVDAISTEVGQLSIGIMETSQTVTILMIIIGAVSVAFAFVVAIYLGRVITRPLNKMKAVMLQAGSTGNLHFSEETREDIAKEARAKDEIGQSLAAFTTFIDHISNVASTLEVVASKDLSIEVQLLSKDDTMGVALRDMVENLNRIFSEINLISQQVAVASSEVANGAQALAQGSTEQAATVQEISASVNEINEQMNTSSATAGEAARQGDEIGNIAQEGNDKMNQMMGAMQEINNASQAIAQVISVIDNIAFQTNILALNASVEAARAGQHGKGFAVVAEEVRNLAQKSATAAKETADLITTNLEKTGLGLSYSEETAKSLTRIVDAIERTNESLQAIVMQSESAKQATGQVGIAIDQVSQVVQQNSATSQQSAAASEQMSSQAQTLESLIRQFKLRESFSHPELLPYAPPAGRSEAFIPEGDNKYTF